MKKEKTTDKTTPMYSVGHLYHVALSLIQLPPVELTARYHIGNNFVSVLNSIKEHGQRVPCGAQLLSKEQQAAHPGKVFLLTEGIAGRYEAAKALGLELEILLHEPYTNRQILERNVATFDMSAASPMDISAAAIRLANIGLSIDDQCKALSWVAGKGKPLGKGRLEQYKRLARLPLEVQQMAHMGPVNGGMMPSAALHMTNTDRTPEQYAAIVKSAQDRIKREAAEQWDRDKAYLEREKDAVIKSAMGEEQGERPAYEARKRVKAEGAPLAVADITAAEAEVMGISPKPDKRAEKPVAELMSHEELFTLCELLRGRDGLYIELANCIEGVIKRAISNDEFCEAVEAIFSNGTGVAHKIRRQVQEKLSKSLGKRKADGRRATDKPAEPVAIDGVKVPVA